MAKRKREDANVVPSKRHHAQGRSNRVERKLADAAADKENLPCSRRIEQLKSTQIQTKQVPHPFKTHHTTSNKPSRSTILQLKTNNTVNMLLKHPVSDYVTRPNVYNENWIARQQYLFTGLVNEVFKSRCSQEASWDDETLQKNRKIAFEYYQSPTFQVVVRRLRSVLNSHLNGTNFQAFSTKRLALKEGSHHFRDIGLRSSIKDLLCSSYNSLWLALGLEPVTGRSYPATSRENTQFFHSFIDSVHLTIVIN
jgi:hypothetical protein